MSGGSGTQCAGQLCETRRPARIEHPQRAASWLGVILPRGGLHRILGGARHFGAKESVHQARAAGGAVADKHETWRTLQEKERLDRCDLAQDRRAQSLGQPLHQALEFFVEGEKDRGIHIDGRRTQVIRTPELTWSSSRKRLPILHRRGWSTNWRSVRGRSLRFCRLAARRALLPMRRKRA